MFKASHCLQQLIDCVFPNSDARDLPITLACAASVLDGAGLTFVVAGRVAQARYCRAQFTAAVSLRVEERHDLGPLLARLQSKFIGSLSPGSTVTLMVGIITKPAERALMASAARVTWLGTELPLASPEHLLWLALHSRLPYADVDAVDLFNSDHLNWKHFLDVAEADQKLIARAKRLRLLADRARYSTYSSMVERRTATHRKPQFR